MKQQRIGYLIAFLALMCVEVFIALYVNDRFIRPYVGDILVVVVIYCAIRVIIPSKLRLLPLWIFIFAAGVECLQYINIVEILGVQDNTVLRIVIGTTFDWMDIVCYAIGGILLAGYEWLIRKNKKRLE